MYVKILYHPFSEHDRAVEEFKHEFTKRTAKEVELVSLETREGANLASLYEIITYPAVLACKDDGQLLKLWQNDKLPLINEVSYYARESSQKTPHDHTEKVLKPPTHHSKSTSKSSKSSTVHKSSNSPKKK